ncbi:phage baseplate protein [Anaerostipes caccae]|uniref:phage baseplate protein n=1 Tax=Anaerostipes caccae TaxID=105841 RepID=UPI0038D4D55E
MNIWESTVLTDKGSDLQAKLVDGQTLQITKVMTGALKVPVVNLRQQTSVTEGGKRINLQEARTEGDKMILPVFLENTNLEEGYDLWQVGIYAQDPEEGEILYCIAQTSAAKHIPSASESPGFSITWDFCFKTSNTSPFEVAVNSVGLVNIEQFQVHAGEINHLKSSIVNLDGRIEDLNSALFDKIYPVGSVYLAINNIDPNSKFGGIWAKISDGYCLMSSNSNYGETDGSNTHRHETNGHILTQSEIPRHTHGSRFLEGSARVGMWKTYEDGDTGILDAYSAALNLGSTSGTNWGFGTLAVKATHTHDNVGDDASHTHGDTKDATVTPLHIKVAMWHRTE